MTTADAPGGDRRGAPSGLTPESDIAAAGQGLAEMPGQGARKAKKQTKGLISEACGRRQLVPQFPLLHRKNCGRNRRRLRTVVYTALSSGPSARPTLPERDECEHSQNSGSRSMMLPCQNRGPAKNELGPSPEGDGNSREVAESQRQRDASMGPPPFGDGNCYTTDRGCTRLRASMGPPPFGDGNCYTTDRAAPAYVLQWGHRLSAMETVIRRIGLHPPTCFNGATDFRR